MWELKIPTSGKIGQKWGTRHCSKLPREMGLAPARLLIQTDA
jgi:hypothetical protein